MIRTKSEPSARKSRRLVATEDDSLDENKIDIVKNSRLPQDKVVILEQLVGIAAGFDMTSEQIRDERLTRQ